MLINAHNFIENPIKHPNQVEMAAQFSFAKSQVVDLGFISPLKGFNKFRNPLLFFDVCFNLHGILEVINPNFFP